MKRLFLLAAAMITAFGCSHVATGPGSPGRAGGNIPPAILKNIESLENANPGLKTFKGTGRIKIIDKVGVTSFRMIFAGNAPDRIRIILMHISGGRAITMATDGKYFHMLSHADDKYYKKRMGSGFNLQKAIKIPITFDGLIAYITGRLNTELFTSASIAGYGLEKVPEGFVITLKKGSGKSERLTEKIYLDEGRSLIKRMERFDESGKKVFTVDLESYRAVADYVIPFSCRFRGKESKILINIYRYMPNAKVDGAAFAVAPVK